MPYDETLQQRLRLVGARLRVLRENAGLSQEALAHEAGMHRTYIGSVERGERNLSLGSLYVLTDALGAEVTSVLRD